MKWITGAVGVLVALAACEDQEAEPAGDAPVEAEAPAAAPPATGPADASVSTINATLTEWSVTLSQDSIPAGTVTFQIQNTGAVEHRLEVEAEVGDGEWSTDALAPGASVTMSVNLEAGVYEVYCPLVAGGTNHKERGMRTRLRVY